MKITTIHTEKLDDRSILVVYLGVEIGSKAHKLYDPQSGKLKDSTDVVFDEGMELEGR